MIKVPRISGEISFKKLHKILKNQLKARVFLVDGKYQLVSKWEMRRFLKEDKTDLIKYVPEYRDCDDIAWVLLGAINSGAWAGIAFGFAFSDTHAFNIFVSDKEEVFIIEPQTDNIVTVKEIKSFSKKESYLPMRLVMM